MKAYKYILLVLLTTVLASCSDWFEVEADNEVTKEELFSTYDGYRTALNGIYREFAKPELYGQEMSWLFVSCLGQNYDVAAAYLWSEYPWAKATEYDYEHADVKDITEAIWEKGYNIIANCNVLIKNAEAKEPDFFYEGEREKNVLLGEAKGLRAFMHFDLLRLFAPAPIVNNNNAFIPYVSEYPEFNPQHLPVNAVMDSIIADLTYARNMLADNDTLQNAGMMSSVAYRFHNNVTGESNGGTFYSFRGTRMNYFAATALLARAYLYKGDKENAYRFANEVYRYANWFPFTPASNLENSNRQYRYCKMYDDILLAFSNSNLYTIYENWYGYVYARRLPVKNREDLFAGDFDDFRYSRLIYEGYSLKWEPVTLDPNMPWMNSNIVDFEGPLEPIIRMSEVYYIMCEYLADTDLPRAIQLLDDLRTARGCKTELSTSLTRDEFLNVLWNDETREFVADGQTFFLYKRLNQPMYNGSTPINMDGKFVIPLPESERSYY